MTMAAKCVPRPIVDMAEGERESLTFAALRDALLPKLISGDLKLKVAPRLAGIA